MDSSAVGLNHVYNVCLGYANWATSYQSPKFDDTVISVYKDPDPCIDPNRHLDPRTL